MATLIDHRTRTKTTGQASTLIEGMVTAQMLASTFACQDRERYAWAVVTAAIRRGGRTHAGQELLLSPAERAEWEATHPVW